VIVPAVPASFRSVTVRELIGTFSDEYVDGIVNAVTTGGVVSSPDLGSVNTAVTVVLAFRVNEHVGTVEQLDTPDHPVKTEPGVGVAVRLTVEPGQLR
jgi:hypothetical protein